MPRADGCLLRSVQLVNFMCHHNLLVEFTKQTTCIVGSNGSGKSAIMIGLGTLFGLKAAAMERGSSVRQLIRTGETFAVVRAKLANTDYQVGVFGEVITVEKRLLAEGGASLKIIAASGKVVGHTQEDLHLLLEHFRLSLGNPVCFLTQDQAKKLLRAANLKMAYSFFKTGVDLEDTETIHRQNVEAVEQMQSALASAERKKAQLGRTQESVKTALKIRQSHRHLEEQLKTLEIEQAWAAYHAKETERYAAEKTKEALYAEYSQSSAGRAAARQSLAQVREAMGNLTAERRQRHVQKQRLEEELEEKASREQKRQQAIARELEHFAAEAAKHAGHLARLERIIGEENAPQRANTLESLECLKAARAKEVGRLEQAETAAELQRHEMEQRIAAQQAELRSVEQAQRRKEEALRAAREFSPLAFYRPQMGAALREIQAQGIAAIGPLGLHLKVKEQRWARAIEAALGVSLFGFIVHREADLRALEQVLQRNGVGKYRIYLTPPPGGAEPGSAGGSVLEKARAVSQRLLAQAQAPRPCGSQFQPAARGSLSTVLAQLEESLPLVVEQLVVVLNIEKLGLVENRQTGYGLLREQIRFEALFTPEADRIQYVGQSLSDLRCALKDKRLLGVQGRPQEIEQELQQLEATKREWQASCAVLVNERAGLTNKAAELREQKLHLKRSIAEIDEDIKKKQEMLADELVLEHARVAELKAQAERQAASIQETYQEVSRTVAALARQQAESRAAALELAEHEDRLHRKQLKELAVQEEALQQTVRTADEALQRLQGEITSTEKAVEQLALEGIRLKELSLEKSGGRLLAVPATPSEIEAELCALRAKLAVLSAEAGTAEELEEKQAAVASELARLEQVIADNQRAVLEIEKWTAKRIELREVLKVTMSQEAAASFAALMERREYAGSLEFSHEREELDIRVRVSEQSTGNKHSLSGGERSFASLCFLLALWPLVSSPLRVLDEFDVFMDGLNRKAALQLIIEIARTLPSQIILITPLNIAEVSPEHCQVITLKAPVKG